MNNHNFLYRLLKTTLIIVLFLFLCVMCSLWAVANIIRPPASYEGVVNPSNETLNVNDNDKQFVPSAYTANYRDYSAFYDAFNRYRIKKGLPIVLPSNELEESANNKLNYMIDNNCWDHDCGGKFYEMIRVAGFKYKFAGENLAEGYFDIDKVMLAWDASPSHQSNMIDTDYTYQGIAIACGVAFQKIGNNCVFVHHFASVLDQE